MADGTTAAVGPRRPRVDSGPAPGAPVVRSSTVRYLLVGVLLAAADFTTFLALTSLGASVAGAQLAARGLGAALGFVLHRYVTFDGLRLEQHHAPTTQAALYAVLTVVVVLGSGPFVAGCVATVGNLVLGKLLGDVLLFLGTYLCTRWLFRPAQRAAS